jgi:hypothetical protein
MNRDSVPVRPRMSGICRVCDISMSCRCRVQTLFYTTSARHPMSYSHRLQEKHHKSSCYKVSELLSVFTVCDSVTQKSIYILYRKHIPEVYRNGCKIDTSITGAKRCFAGGRACCKASPPRQGARAAQDRAAGIGAGG